MWSSGSTSTGYGFFALNGAMVHILGLQRSKIAKTFEASSETA